MKGKGQGSKEHTLTNFGTDRTNIGGAGTIVLNLNLVNHITPLAL
jgi:hypothetical protein